MEFKKYHTGEWSYSLMGTSYIKVGAFGMDDLEYVTKPDGSVYLPGKEIHHPSLEEAYVKENESWVEHEKSL